MHLTGRNFNGFFVGTVEIQRSPVDSKYIQIANADASVMIEDQILACESTTPRPQAVSR